MALTIANKITIARILAVPFFVTAVLSYSPQADHFRYVALGIYLFAAVSDVLDGYIARKRGQTTAVGAILDPLADKVLLVSAFVCLYIVGSQFPVLHFPVWLVVAVISRDILLVIGSLLLLMFYRRLDVKVSWWGKAAMFVQAACVIGLLLQWSWTSLFWYAALFFTAVSGVDYLIKGFRILTEKELV
ncbi:MAG: CDP-diacylglycerol--glycerol-3-phosphate 3-phosphatidyltransferase [Candidatus Omnitrophica bacterium]|nr:CDP-diacylglycerol--glycerol-3-phosphate 3-phosphatidyltransferase [Candidatus Omnitrophota bacterium]